MGMMNYVASSILEMHHHVAPTEVEPLPFGTLVTLRNRDDVAARPELSGRKAVVIGANEDDGIVLAMVLWDFTDSPAVIQYITCEAVETLHVLK